MTASLLALRGDCPLCLFLGISQFREFYVLRVYVLAIHGHCIPLYQASLMLTICLNIHPQHPPLFLAGVLSTTSQPFPLVLLHWVGLDLGLASFPWLDHSAEIFICIPSLYIHKSVIQVSKFLF